MKTKVISLAIFVAILCIGMANGQITPSTKKVSLTGEDRAIPDQRISKYSAFTIDKKELADNRRTE